MPPQAQFFLSLIKLNIDESSSLIIFSRGHSIYIHLLKIIFFFNEHRWIYLKIVSLFNYIIKSFPRIEVFFVLAPAFVSKVCFGSIIGCLLPLWFINILKK